MQAPVFLAILKKFHIEKSALYRSRIATLKALWLDINIYFKIKTSLENSSLQHLTRTILAYPTGIFISCSNFLTFGYLSRLKSLYTYDSWKKILATLIQNRMLFSLLLDTISPKYHPLFIVKVWMLKCEKKIKYRPILP